MQSQNRIDKPDPVARGKVVAVIGHVGRDTLVAVNLALVLFFGLA